MESEEDEPISPQSKRSKPQTPNQDSVLLLMPALPAELITEILFKLPVKSLLKFRSVSKSWLSLISSPDFVKTHLLLSSNSSSIISRGGGGGSGSKDYVHHGLILRVSNPDPDVAVLPWFVTRGCPNHGIKECSLSSLLYESVTEAFDLDYPRKDPHYCPRIWGSVNGLICVTVGVFDGLHDDLFLWNPSTRKCSQLPRYKLRVSKYYYGTEPTDFKFGFVYDELEEDYKVVGVFPIYDHGGEIRTEVRIYSLKMDDWRRIGNYDSLPSGELLDESGKFVNGKLHWPTKGLKIVSIDLADEKWVDLADEKWVGVDQPSDFKGCGPLVLGVFGSDLSVLCNYAGTHVDLWVMKEYGVKESWTKLFTINSLEVSVEKMFKPPILMSNNGEILVQFGLRFVRYNPKDDSIRYLDVTNLAPCHEAEIYVKSIVCPYFYEDQQIPQPRQKKKKEKKSICKNSVG